MSDYSGSWSNATALEFYKNSRNKRGDVYKSEGHFLSKIIKPGMSILDVGCAAGGFYEILKSYEKSIDYCGVDFSEEMIRHARDMHPEAKFFVSDGGTLPFESKSFDLVISLGTLPMILHWKGVLRELWRITKKEVLCDLRVSINGESIADIKRSFQRVAFDGKWDGKSKSPYVVVSAKETMEAISMLEPSPSKVEIYGYTHPVAATASTPFKEVCMACFLLEKNSSGNKAMELVQDAPVVFPK
jgi:ubiquinone/menaquinone biosynthesis C-methylase UbiE